MRTWKEVKEWLVNRGFYTHRDEESLLKAKYENNPIEFFSRYIHCYFPVYSMVYNSDYLEYLSAWNEWIKEGPDNTLPEYDVYYKHTKRYLCTVNAHSVNVELVKNEVKKLYPDIELLFYEPDKARENWLKFYTYDKEVNLKKI